MSIVIRRMDLKEVNRFKITCEQCKTGLEFNVAMRDHEWLRLCPICHADFKDGYEAFHNLITAVMRARDTEAITLTFVVEEHVQGASEDRIR